MAIVKRLGSRGYLVRGKPKTDGRKQTLNLTGADRKALVTFKRAIQQHEQWLKARISNKETDKLIELLSRIHA